MLGFLAAPIEAWEKAGGGGGGGGLYHNGQEIDRWRGKEESKGERQTETETDRLYCVGAARRSFDEHL